MLWRRAPLVSLCLCMGLGRVFGQADPSAVVQLGGAPSWNLKDSGSSNGPGFAVEFTPIKRWLEVEAGVTRLSSRHSTELGAAFLFKKPWTLSKKVELEPGIGPVWVHSRQLGTTTNQVAGQAVLDFMFWPSEKRKFGWYVEPGYQYNFGPGHERSFGMSVGLLIAIP